MENIDQSEFGKVWDLQAVHCLWAHPDKWLPATLTELRMSLSCRVWWPSVSDVDECLESAISPCQHQCVNTLGSYRCICHPGYQLSGQRCVGQSSPTPATVYSSLAVMEIQELRGFAS